MTRVIFLCFFSLLFILPSFAQTEEISLQNGFIAFEAKRYEDAVKILAQLIENENDIPEKHLAKAHFYLAQSYREVANHQEIRDKYPEALLRAYNHLRAVKYLDQKKEYISISEDAISLLWPEVYNEGIRAYNDQKYDRAVIFFAKVRQINPRYFEASLNQGYAHWLLGDTLAAIKNWEKATQLYQSIGRKQSEIAVAKAYGIMAEAYNERGMANQAILTLKEGKEFFPFYTPLKDIELKIYQKHPEFIELVEEKLKSRIESEPENHNLKLVYGSLLTNENQQEAANNLYLSIIDSKPKHFEANLRLATYYVNQAFQLQEENSGQKEVETQLSQAIPYLETLHDLQPQNLEWIKQLATIYSLLNQPKKNKYLRLLEKLDK